jgi:hypothetical protein
MHWFVIIIQTDGTVGGVIAPPAAVHHHQFVIGT